MRSRWEEAVPLALRMATEQGRMKFTRPLFRSPPTAVSTVERLLSDHLLLLLRREVSSLEKFREEAASWFVAHRAAMHPVTAALLAKDLKVPGGL